MPAVPRWARRFPLWATLLLCVTPVALPLSHAQAETRGSGQEGKVQGEGPGRRTSAAGRGLGLSWRLASWPAEFREQAGLGVGVGGSIPSKASPGRHACWYSQV